MNCPDCNTLMTGVEYAYPCLDRYDGVSEYACDKCGVRIGRWSGKRLMRGETEPRFGGAHRERCANADKYQAVRSPTCGCLACMRKWRDKQ